MTITQTLTRNRNAITPPAIFPPLFPSGGEPESTEYDVAVVIVILGLGEILSSE